MLAIQAAKSGKGRIIEPGPHGEANHQPSGDEDRQIWRDGLHQQTDRQQDGAGSQDRATAEALDEMTDTR